MLTLWLQPFRHHPAGSRLLPVCWAFCTSWSECCPPACPYWSLPPPGKGVLLGLCLLRWDPVWFRCTVCWLSIVICLSTLMAFPPSLPHCCVSEAWRIWLGNADVMNLFLKQPTVADRNTVGGSGSVSCLLWTNTHVFYPKCLHTLSHLNIIPQGNRYYHSPILKEEEIATDRNCFIMS